jgi:hypothetical protein
MLSVDTYRHGGILGGKTARKLRNQLRQKCESLDKAPVPGWATRGALIQEATRTLRSYLRTTVPGGRMGTLYKALSDFHRIAGYPLLVRDLCS